jgi:hypothetical protein
MRGCLAAFSEAAPIEPKVRANRVLGMALHNKNKEPFM